MAQSLKPIHGIRVRATDPPTIAVRREHLSAAMASSDLGSLLRRAVRMYAEPVHSIGQVYERIESVRDSLQKRLTESGRGSLPPELIQLTKSVICSNGFLDGQETRYCSLPMALLEFVTYECLCNALSYFDESKPIQVLVTVAGGEGRASIVLSVKNAVHPDHRDNPLSERSGIAACKVAAKAVLGTFDSRPTAAEYLAVLEIPIFLVPDDLAGELNALLKR